MRIQLRLGAALAALVALGVLVSAYAAERGLRARELEAITDSLEERARLVRELFAEPASESPRPAALQQIAQRAARSGNARVTLIAPDGTVLADSEVPGQAVPRMENHAARTEVAAALQGRVGSDTRLSRTVGRPFLYLGVPGAGGGAVRLAVDVAYIEREAAALRRTLWAAGALAVVLAGTLGVVLAGRIIQPLRELRDFLAGLARGDPYRPLPWRTPDEFGDIALAIDQVNDALEQRLEGLTAERERLRAVLNGMVEGVLVVDRAGRVVLANQRLRELFGVWGEVAGRSPLEVIRRTEVESALERAAARSAPVVAELRAGSEGERVVQLHAVPFPARGEQQGTVAVFQDVTEIQRLERVRVEFVANVSHELKTPLTAIRGFAETLQSEDVPAEQRREYLEIVLRHVARLNALIDDLLELSRIEGRQEPIERTRVAVEPLATGLVEDMRPRLAARRLEAAVVGGAGLQALTDRRALERVLLNLLDNAVKYTDPGGRLQVRIGRDGERVRIDVSDNGIGIPESDRPRVFERFYRVDAARARDLRGTGLGLSIVKHLVQAVGGEVFVESREGKGSTFSVLLPPADAP